MSKVFSTFICLAVCFSCDSKDKKPLPTTEEATITTIKESEDTKVNTNEITAILNLPTTRYTQVLDDYKFNLPFNYRVNELSTENTPNHYFKMCWKVKPDFEIDSQSEGFRRFQVYNFIDIIPFSSDQGEFYIFKKNNSSDVKIEDFIKPADKVIYKDNNSAIYIIDGKYKAIYFDYLADKKEYILFSSDSPFWNIRPELSPDLEVNQLIYHLRMAKNVLKPITSQTQNWSMYKSQLSKLENSFFEKLNTEVVNAYKSDPNRESFSPADAGNTKYYSVFKTNQKMEDVWKKLSTISPNTKLKINENDFKYLFDNDFRFFYSENCKLVSKTDKSLIYQRGDAQAFCLISKSKSGNYFIFKEFPELQQMPANYYQNEINFYKELFENSF
ncbi:hypothetical protein [Soonwooa sp.]|uniref:hypothetical protein n=1 Tax=Soonwooa sp. TaxID=1938592 RepID=UPI002615CA67|nr:hypothetical protein [Soonwooa sp.]